MNQDFEADDVIASLSEKFTDVTNGKVFIFSGDKDLLQLVNPRISVKNRLKNKEIVYNNKNFHELVGLLPKQIIDYKSICGDSSDNIPGVKGIGKKGAMTLLK